MEKFCRFDTYHTLIKCFHGKYDSCNTYTIVVYLYYILCWYVNESICCCICWSFLKNLILSRIISNGVVICFTSFVQRIHNSTLLKGSIIKDAVWDDKGFRFFYGDEHGRVAVANVPRVCLISHYDVLS